MTGTLVVTGGGGFVGSHAARHFAKGGWKVLAFDNLSRSSLLGGREGPIPPRYNWDNLRRLDGVRCIEGDVRKTKELGAVIADADAIVHTAAQVAVTSSLEDPRTDFEVNLLGTFNVLEAARRSGRDPRIVFCSTNKVYGDNVNRIPVREEGSRYAYDDPAFLDGIPTDYSIDACEHTPYGVSKLAADLYVQDFAKTYGLKTAVFRMSCIYGEGQSGNEDQGWVAHFVINILKNRPLTIYGDGKQVRDVLHVQDLVRAFDEAIASDEAMRGGVFNIGGGAHNTTSLLELVQLMKSLTGREASLTFADWRPGDQKVYISNVLHAKKTFGWAPEVSPEDGIRRLTRWYDDEFGSKS